MDFYVASAWSDRARAAALIAELERRGHRCTYNWTTQDEPAPVEEPRIGAAVCPGWILTDGAVKYIENGWRSVPNARARYFAAMLRHEDVAAMTEISEQEFAAVAGAHVFIFLLPGARGSHVEFGIALAAGAFTYVIGTPEQRTGPYGVPCGFHHLADFQHETVEEFLAALAEDR